MDVTVTCNLQPCTRQNLNAIERHVQHDKDVNHSNKQIVFSDTELNKTYVLHNRDDVLHAHYDDYIKSKNEKLKNDFSRGKISLNRYEERKTNVNKIVANKKAYTEILLTVSNADTQRKIYDALSYKYRVDKIDDKHERYTLTDASQRHEWSERMNRVYLNTAKQINGKGFVVTQLTSNFDEGGAAHCHVSAVNTAETASHKPSSSLNRAVISFLNATNHTSEISKNNIENFKILRVELDNMLLDNFNREFSKDLNTVKLIRKTATDDTVVTNRDMRTYQHDQQTATREKDEKKSESNDVNNILSHVHKHTHDVTMYDQQRSQRISDDAQRRQQRLNDQATRDAQLALQRALREQEQDLKREKEKNERKKTELEKREQLLDERELQSKHVYKLTTIKAVLDDVPITVKAREIVKSYVVRKLEEQQIQDLRTLQQSEKTEHETATARYEKEFDKLEL